MLHSDATRKKALLVIEFHKMLRAELIPDNQAFVNDNITHTISLTKTGHRNSSLKNSTCWPCERTLSIHCIQMASNFLSFSMYIQLSVSILKHWQHESPNCSWGEITWLLATSASYLNRKGFCYRRYRLWPINNAASQDRIVWAFVNNEFLCSNFRLSIHVHWHRLVLFFVEGFEPLVNCQHRRDIFHCTLWA